MSLLCKRRESTQTRFHLTIRPYFQTKKSHFKTPQNRNEEMIRPWAELSNSQYERLRKLKEKTGNPLSQMIRKAVTSFVTKKDYSISISASHLPKTTREDHRGVTAYFHRSDWNLLEKISKGTGTCKTGLIREAVDEYMTELLRALH